MHADSPRTDRRESACICGSFSEIMRLNPFPAIVLILTSGLWLLNAGPQGVDGDRAFAVVRANCLGCHDSKLRAGKLLMETTEDLLKGGTHGPAVIPGKSGESRLVKMILGEIAPKMPLQ